MDLPRIPRGDQPWVFMISQGPLTSHWFIPKMSPRQACLLCSAAPAALHDFTRPPLSQYPWKSWTPRSRVIMGRGPNSGGLAMLLSLFFKTLKYLCLEIPEALFESNLVKSID